MKSIILLPFLVLACALSHGQTDTSWNFDIGYSGGNIVHPGINVGALKAINTTEKERRNGKIIKKEIQIGARTGFYYHRNYNSGLWLQGEIAQLRSKRDSRYQKYSLGIGGLQTWVPKVYSVNNQGAVEFKSAKGIFYGMVSPAVEWGWSIKKDNKLLDSWYIRPRLQWHFPYFLGTNEYLLFEIGFNLK